MGIQKRVYVAFRDRRPGFELYDVQYCRHNFDGGDTVVVRGKTIMQPEYITVTFNQAEIAWVKEWDSEDDTLGGYRQ